MEKKATKMNDAILLAKWKELEDIPFSEADSLTGQILERDWWRFKKGDDRSVIWKFFDNHYSEGVRSLLYGEVELSKPEKTFADAIFDGDVSIGDIDYYVDYWHTHDTGTNLIEFLDITDEEYSSWLKTADDEALKIAIIHRKNVPVSNQTFFLSRDEYNEICGYLGSRENATNTAENWSEDCAYKVYSKRSVSRDVFIGLELHCTKLNKYSVVVTVYENGTRQAIGGFMFSLSERLVFHYGGRAYDVGVDVQPSHDELCSMFDSGRKHGSKPTKSNALALLYWPKNMTVFGVVTLWLNQQRALYIFNNEQLWFTFDGRNWELFERDDRADGTMVTVYKSTI